MRERLILPLVALTLLLFPPAGLRATHAADSVPAKVMEAEFQSLDRSAPIKLSNYKGKVVVVALLASWCPPCNSAVKELIGFNDEFVARGVEVVGLTMRSSATDAGWVSGFAGGTKINFKLGWLTQEAVDSWLSKMETVPQILVLDGDGKVVRRFSGWSERVPPQLRKTVEKRLAKTRASR
jgi:thiol-disulfide isomerase/thioredoxin